MSLKSKLTVPLIALLIPAITACSTISVNGPAVSSQQINTGSEKPYIIDLGHKGGVSIPVRININDGNGFQTKNNTLGHRFVRADVDRVRVFLTTTPGTGDISLTPLSPIANMVAPGYVELTKPTGGTIDVIFSNAPGNASYRVAVCALTTTARGLTQNGLPDFPSPRDITKGTGTFAKITLSGKINTYVLSSTGGNTNAPGNGILTVGSDLSIPAGNAPLGVALTLIDADGATIDSRVNVSEPSPVPSVTLPG